MDEPFASLDAIVRARISQDVAALVERAHISVLLVTHDPKKRSVSRTTFTCFPEGRAPSLSDIRCRCRGRASGPRAHACGVASLYQRIWNDLLHERAAIMNPRYVWARQLARSPCSS